MIEVSMVNGCRRLIRVESIVQIAELPHGKNSNIVISLTTGEVIFAADDYDAVKNGINVGGGS
ncbi:hypothetical protein [Cytobacillus purgationiresistens]|uniref:Uncharacterized protein YlzI (FlbEa/FlbD family) n=1 Tax=Cytobacillus purgationiresistens TaxID=863449 RepID=A0ABU0AJA4_9BACI|nr:hypothetical protein [Cytobacillus purgationiresistens]MDQ0270801.1 uncharacterized protein YlzI (FlbEa/FlbD family) [Cytobacillus purgationiresistens]